MSIGFNLRELNLADNSFIGSVPSSLTQNSKLKLDVSGNPDLCAPGQSCDTSGTSARGGTGTTASYRRRRKNNLGLALGLSLPLSFIFCVTLATVFFLRSRTNPPRIAANGQMNTNHSNPGASHHADAMSNHHADRQNRIQIELRKQMALELGDLVNQQAQAYQDGNNTDTLELGELVNQQAQAYQDGNNTFSRVMQEHASIWSD